MTSAFQRLSIKKNSSYLYDSEYKNLVTFYNLCIWMQFEKKDSYYIERYFNFICWFLWEVGKLDITPNHIKNNITHENYLGIWFDLKNKINLDLLANINPKLEYKPEQFDK